LLSIAPLVVTGLQFGVVGKKNLQSFTEIGFYEFCIRTCRIYLYYKILTNFFRRWGVNDFKILKVKNEKMKTIQKIAFIIIKKSFQNLVVKKYFS